MGPSCRHSGNHNTVPVHQSDYQHPVRVVFGTKLGQGKRDGGEDLLICTEMTRHDRIQGTDYRRIILTFNVATDDHRGTLKTLENKIIICHDKLQASAQ